VVSVPMTDSQDYDLIVEKAGELFRVQVKSTRYKNPRGDFEINLSVKGGNQSFNTIKKFDNTRIEFLVALTNEGTLYVIPSNIITAKTNLILGEKYKEYRVPAGLKVDNAGNLYGSPIFGSKTSIF
jgi:hypothetical protein